MNDPSFHLNQSPNNKNSVKHSHNSSKGKIHNYKNIENNLCISGHTIIPDSISHIRRFGFIEYEQPKFESSKISMKPLKPTLRIKLNRPTETFSSEEEQPKNVTSMDIKLFEASLQRMKQEQKRNYEKYSKQVVNSSHTNSFFTTFLSTNQF